MKKDKNIVCCFEEGIFMDEDYEKYENFNDKHLFRYSLTCDIQKNGKPITVILMNPSYADEYGLDATLVNVRKFLTEIGGYSKFQVLNIFPIRTADSSDLIGKMKRYSKYQKQNDEYLKEILAKSEDVLLAWGSKYHSNAKWIFDYLKDKNVYAYCINEDRSKSPRHFAPQSYNKCTEKKLQKYEFIK